MLSAFLVAALLSATACAPSPRGDTMTVTPAPQIEEEAYTTYFSFDSKKLDDDARAVVAEAVASAKAPNLEKVVISGHSDSVGAADYNRRLSMARVEAVASEFVDSGLPFSIAKTHRNVSVAALIAGSVVSRTASIADDTGSSA